MNPNYFRILLSLFTLSADVWTDMIRRRLYIHLSFTFFQNKNCLRLVRSKFTENHSDVYKNIASLSYIIDLPTSCAPTQILNTHLLLELNSVEDKREREYYIIAIWSGIVDMIKLQKVGQNGEQVCKKLTAGGSITINIVRLLRV